MSRIKMSEEEKAERRRIQQRNYYLKKKAERKGLKDIREKPEFILSAEVIQKNWARIQRTVFSEDVRSYFVQHYQKELRKKLSENNQNFPATECSDFDQKIKVKPEYDIPEKSELSINDC